MFFCSAFLRISNSYCLLGNRGTFSIFSFLPNLFKGHVIYSINVSGHKGEGQDPVTDQDIVAAEVAVTVVTQDGAGDQGALRTPAAALALIQGQEQGPVRDRDREEGQEADPEGDKIPKIAEDFQYGCFIFR